MMVLRVLEMGDKGQDVGLWQTFLRGQRYPVTVDGRFGPQTLQATESFQREHGAPRSGRVDDATLGAAMVLGFSVLDDEVLGHLGPNWPPAPTDPDMQPLGGEGRELMFGKFVFRADPMDGNAENIAMDMVWVHANLTTVKLPSLAGQKLDQVVFHRLGAEKLRALFEAWKKEGLLDRVRTWDGGFAPRFVRGSKSVLSAHAWGSAFDINARWNSLGTVPALLHQAGCVRELVAIANSFGFFWGGHYNGGSLGKAHARLDGMHFELVKLD